MHCGVAQVKRWTENERWQVDWAKWSKDSVSLMQSRNEQWLRAFRLADVPYDWNLDDGTLRFVQSVRVVLADICVVGTVSAYEGSFLWGWANDSLPVAVTNGLLPVRRFGEEHGLEFLMTAEIAGGREEGLECAAIAGRIQNAEGVFVDTCGDVTMFFTLSGFREGHKA